MAATDTNMMDLDRSSIRYMKPPTGAFGKSRVQKFSVSPNHGEPLQLMQQEVGPLGLCFLLLWFPTDCLCPRTNRISHASFPMVFCPVLASWWMELHTEEWVCLEVCPVLVRQRGRLRPQASICFGQYGHLWCRQVHKRSPYNVELWNTIITKQFWEFFIWPEEMSWDLGIYCLSWVCVLQS